MSRKYRAAEAAKEQAYSCSLQMYPMPPDGNISLADFDSMAVERLIILRSIERNNLNGPLKGSQEWVEKIYEDFHKNKNFIFVCESKSSHKQADMEEARRRDHVSHYILRLAYCRTEDLRRWFVAQEVDLFKARFLHTAGSKKEIARFMQENNLHFDQVPPEEVERERANLIAGSRGISGGDQLEGRAFFKVPFTEALELVRSRKVFLKRGLAYVPDTELVTLIASVYRTNLSKALAHTCRSLPQLDDDDRLLSLLRDFDRRYTGADFSEAKPSASITPQMIDGLAAKSFPLCMRSLHDTLSSTHHLKHGGRMQYGLFLKAAGLSLQDAMVFWRSHFTKAMDVDKFDKQYAYNIRHNYGKEGKRTDYTAYSCIKIITGSVGPGDAHGCPFKLTEAPLLRQRLMAHGVSQQQAGAIAELARQQHFQIACQRYWEARHGAALENGVTHPNQYLEDARLLASGQERATPRAKADLPKTRRSVAYSSQPPTPSTPSTPAPTHSDDMDDLDDFDMDGVEELEASLELAAS